MRKQWLFGAGISSLLLLILGSTLLVSHAMDVQAAPALSWPSYQRGSSGENVRSIQYMLNHHGAKLTADGLFGPATTAAVKSFQSRSHLTADGIVGNQTWPRLIVPTRTGSSGAAVSALQRQLNVHGANIAVDGKFGPATAAALKSFQARAHVAATGIADLTTWNKLVSIAPPPPAAKLPDINSFGPKIEGFAPYVGQKTCSPTPKPGVVAFRDMFVRAFPGTGSSGISRACNIGGQSEHKEGRAFDWTVSVNNPRQVAQVNQALQWLFATDKYSHKYAMVRRLGIMYIIWNHRIWSADTQQWKAYHGPKPHTDHVHFSFSWDGAYKRTSFWHR